MGEHSGRNPPGGTVFELGFFVGSLGLFGVDDFVEASEHVATSDVLEGLACLEQEASFWNFNLHPLLVSSPDVQTWESRLAVDGKEGDVVVEACKDGADFVLGQVRSSRGQ